jgi:hypothetical protein
MASIARPERNWSGTYPYAAQQIHRPRTIAELQRLVATCDRRGNYTNLAAR